MTEKQQERQQSVTEYSAGRDERNVAGTGGDCKEVKDISNLSVVDTYLLK